MRHGLEAQKGPAMRKAITCVVGMDLGDRWCVVGGIDLGTGEVLEHRRVRTDPESIERFFAAMPAPARVVLETGTHSPWISRCGERHGHQVLVAQARKLRAIWQSDRKSDDADVDILWQLGQAKPELLAPIRHRSARTQAHLSVLRLREQAVDTRTGLVSAARGTAKSMGYRLPACSPETFHRAAAEALPEELAPALRPLLGAVEALTATIREYDREVVRLCRQEYPTQTRRLLEVHGVGPLTALAFVLVIADPCRFPKSRQVGAYVGLVPRRDQSGDTDRQLPISKAGDRMLRRLLVQCAHHILGPFGKDCDLRRWGLSRVEVGGSARRKKTLVAVARRLAVMLHRLWIDDVAYEPLHRTPAPETAAA